MDDLLALRAGEASVWARRHVEDCATCRPELDSVYQRVAQLKALPALRPPRDRWSLVRDAARVERVRRRRTWSSWGLAAAAALVGVLLVPRFGGMAVSSTPSSRRRKTNPRRLRINCRTTTSMAGY